MNILYVLHYFPVFGGGETVTMTLANELISRGHSIHIVYDEYRSVEVMPYKINEQIKTLKIDNSLMCTRNDIELLNKYIACNKINIIVNQWGSSELCNKARVGTKCKLVVCCHIAPYLSTIDTIKVSKKWKRILMLLFYPFYKRYNLHKQSAFHSINYELSDKYIFLCSSFAEQYKRLSGKRDEQRKISFMHNPNPMEYVQINFSQKAKEVLFVGRISEVHKRISYILKIWQIIEKSERYSDWKLSIVGSGGDLPQTKKQSEKLDLKNVVFYDFQNPKRFYQRSSLFLMTSRLEGLPMTLLEAQSYGCVPIVMDSVSVFSDIIENMQNGVLTPNNNIAAFAEKLQLLMDNQNLREKMAKNAMESVKKFSVENIVDKWEKLFREMTQNV